MSGLTSRLICVILITLIITGGIYITENLVSDTDCNSQVANVFIKVIFGSDNLIPNQRQAEQWIVQEITKLSSPYAWELTDWIKGTNNEQEIYSAMEGGRLIKAQIIQSLYPKKIAIKIVGFKIGTVPRYIIIPCKKEFKKVVKLTTYLGSSNIFLALRLEKK